MKLKILLILSFISALAYSQSRLVLNGGNIIMQNGASLFIENGNADAITVLNTSGGIMINDAASRIRWQIASNYGSYTIPFFSSGSYIPLSFSTSLGTGFGYFDVGTYNTPTWKNSDYLPPGVTNVNSGSTDNSNHIIDRFWSINAQGYVTKPTLSNLVFTYRDAEWNAAGNVISEPLLKAQRWNSTSNTWNDFAPAGTANTTNNTVTIASLSPNHLFQWWTLVDAAFPLPVQLLSFKASLMNNRQVKLDWITTSEVNTKDFIVERSNDRVVFRPIDTILAAGNSNSSRNYSTIDPSPLYGTSYYRLQIRDRDNSFSYSSIAIIILTRSNDIIVFPNPVKDKLNISTGGSNAYSYLLSDAAGRLIQANKIITPSFQLNMQQLLSGTYLLQIITPVETKTFRIIKE
jgi:hypothetical protein